jgi:hypothetical protein
MALDVLMSMRTGATNLLGRTRDSLKLWTGDLI